MWLVTQAFFYETIGVVAWLIQYTDTDIYTWGSLTTTSQMVHAYKSEGTCLYEILAILESLCQQCQLNQGEVDIGYNN